MRERPREWRTATRIDNCMSSSADQQWVKLNTFCHGRLHRMLGKIHSAFNLLSAFIVPDYLYSLVRELQNVL